MSIFYDWFYSTFRIDFFEYIFWTFTNFSHPLDGQLELELWNCFEIFLFYNFQRIMTYKCTTSKHKFLVEGIESSLRVLTAE